MQGVGSAPAALAGALSTELTEGGFERLLGTDSSEKTLGGLRCQENRDLETGKIKKSEVHTGIGPMNNIS